MIIYIYIYLSYKFMSESNAPITETCIEARIYLQTKNVYVYVCVREKQIKFLSGV